MSHYMCCPSLRGSTFSAIRLMNAESTSWQWHMKAMKFYSDSACSVEVSKAGATGVGLQRSSPDAAWTRIDKDATFFDDDTSASAALHSHGNSCPASTCAFEVTLGTPALVQCVKVFQWPSGVTCTIVHQSQCKVLW